MQEIWTRREVLAHAGSRSALDDALASGTIVRVRRDCYCAPDTPAEVVSAVASGGVLGCVSLLALLGVWVTQRPRLHIHRLPHARTPSTSAVVHASACVIPPGRSRASVLDALLQAMLCVSLIDAVATVDSALHQGCIRRADLAPHCLDLRRARILALVDLRSESGLESIVRVALTAAGLRVEIQVQIRGVGRVDLLVEGCVIVETDGGAYHSGPRRHIDHQRDAAATAEGYTALRFDGAQVLFELVALVEAVITAVAAHRAGLDRRDADAARRRFRSALPSLTRSPTRSR